MPLLEGRVSVEAALSARQRRFEVLLVREGMHEGPLAELFELAGQASVPVSRVSRQQIDAVAHAKSHGGVVLVCGPKPALAGDALEDSFARSPHAAWLLLEGVDDARNLGFVIRTAEATGWAGVVVKKHLWDFDEQEVARSASGAYERLPLVRLDETRPIERLCKPALDRPPVRLLGLVPSARRTLFDEPITGGVICAIGGEKRGLSGQLRKLCHAKVTIPTTGGASSLSLSHAAAICCGELLRQRRMAEGENER